MSLRDVILSLVSEHVKGDYKIYQSNKGAQLRARCPFHSDGQEKNPSFYWNLSNGLYFCHSCKAAGGLPTFLKKVGRPAKEIDRLVQESGYSASLRILENPFRRVGKKNVLQSNPVLPESLLGMFNFEPIKMTRTWGFDPGLLEDYEIGYDITAQRITFPIRDVYGRLVGISGRADSAIRKPRYKFYEEEFQEVKPGYRLEKSLLLWNAHRVWASRMSSCGTLGEDTSLVLVEGFKAALYMIGVGFTNTVALMGSSMSRVQKYTLSLLGGRVFIFLDNDRAGRAGSSKILRYLRMGSACTPTLIKYPSGDSYDGAQPDDLSPSIIEQLFSEAIK